MATLAFVGSNRDMGGQSSSPIPCRLGVLVEDMHSLATNIQAGARELGSHHTVGCDWVQCRWNYDSARRLVEAYSSS